MRYIVLLVFLLLPGFVYSAQLCEYTKDGQVFRGKLVKKTMTGLVIEKDGKIKEYKFSEIRFRIIPDPFNKVLVSRNKTFLEGNIKYKKGGQITIEKDSRLMTINTIDVINLVDPPVFHKEMAKSDTTALCLSLLYPGLGQVYTSDREWIGVSFMAGFSLSAFLTVFCYKQTANNYSLYEESKFTNTDYFSRYNTYRVFTWVFAGLSAGIYLWNAFDAYINFNYRFEVDKDFYQEKFEISFNAGF
ncbi:MAG: hypothetical protein GY754_25055 [bacterium]|nr:hypothetical protein [bacterium]